MTFDIDLTSLLAGVSLTAIGGWIASFIAFRKDERAVQLEQVTKERTKWRDNMRMLCEEIAITHVENKASAVPSKVAVLRARLATSINPKDTIHDGAILAHFDRLFLRESDDLKVFVHRIALLLKHDWERVKWECTPLYLKPFKYFSKKQREWNRESYREVEPTLAIFNHGSHVSEEKNKSQVEGFLPQLIGVKPEDITLKFVFDNIKNYAIAASVIAAGVYLFLHGAQVNNFPGAGILFGTLLGVTGIGLHVLNFCQAIVAILKLKVSVVPYIILSSAMFFGSLELLSVLIKQYIQKG